MPFSMRTRLIIGAASALCLLACGGPKEAPRIERSVRIDASAIETVETDLGYRVTLSEARVMVRDFEFTVSGELHEASLWRSVSEFLVPAAWAHPGHFENGTVTGALSGPHLLDWLPGGSVELGTGTFIVGSYEGANFTFARASLGDGLDASDPLLGHTAIFRGVAEKEGRSIEFSFTFDSPEERKLLGLPFEYELEEKTEAPIGIRFAPVDPLEKDTFFDGVDFAELDENGDGELTLGPDETETALVAAYNQLRRTFQTHDHYQVVLIPQGKSP